MEMDVQEVHTGGEQQPRAPTTTISTISVHSGETRLVIALLQSREWLQLKVLEVHPELTKLGASLKEANELQRAHDDVLLQLQNKQSPVEELLRQADQLISNQKPRAEVYAAMAESLGLAWKDVNSHLEQRKLILDLNVAYQSRAEDCIDRMRALEIACQDCTLPVDIDTVKQFLTKLHDLRKLVLESLMAALQDGKLLLEKLKDLSAEGTLDSRPGYIKTSAEFAVSQVEHWLENLHDRRRLLEIAWQNRKTHLEQCLALALLASDLKGLEEVLIVGKEALARGCDHLGNSPASAELLLHEHKKLFPEAKELQDQALKITKATEQLVASGHFAAEQAVAQAYSVLNLSAEYVDAIEQREGLLSHAIAFFRSAHTALTKLDQLEVQLTTTKLSASSPQLIQLHSQISKSLEEITTPPLREGYSLLETVGRGSPGIEGVKRTVDEIENRKIYLGELCTAHREENVQLSQAFTAFLEKQNELFLWLVSIAEAFLQGHQDMGSVLAMAKDFLELHHQLLNDLQKKGTEINALLLTLPPILEFLDDEQREDVDQKVDALHSHWLNLKSMLESRIDLAVIYVKFHSLAVQLASEFDDAEAEFKKSPDGVNEETIRLVEQKWLSIQQLYDQLTNVGKNFTEEAAKVGDPYLDIKRASLCVETLLEHFGNRQIVISESWQTWQTNITVEKEFKVRWEMNITESTRTVDWVSKLDEQLYPVLTTDTRASKAIARELEEKLHTVLSEVKRAQTEIEVRLKATEMLAQRGDTHGQQEVIVDRLMELHKKLQVTITDYQILSQMLISFFKNLAELEKTIETLQSQYQLTRLSNAVPEVELLLKEHEASRQAVLELFKFTQNEIEQIITRIRQQEPPVAAQHDIRRVTVLLEEKRCSWELAWTERKMQLEQHQQLCQFDSDLQLINSSLNDLSTQLSAIRGQYGESSASAKATSLAFVYFEKTIELLQLRIQTFVRTAEQMLLSEHVSKPHIERELRLLQTRWAAFHNQVVESRRLIDLSIEYFKLVEEAEEWFREGSKLLLTIARKSTAVKLPEEATQLLNEVEIFLKPGETRQDERIREISKLAVELYGEERSKQVTLVLNENREMMDSFTVISLELSTLAKNLRAAEEQRERQKKELEEVDASLAAARAEAAAAKAAAAAAEEARKAAETAAKALQEAAPFLQEAKVSYALPLAPSEPDGEKSRKSPSPPLKKAKFTDETPKAVAPVFTVPLHDAAIQEGARFTFQCRVTGSPMPDMMWYKDGIAIQNNPDYQTTFDQGVCTLTIEETFTEDSAKFICRAVNAAGTAETNATLSVKEAEPEEQLSPPVFTKRLEPATAQEGSAFQMDCKVEGNPLPTVQWFKNDVCIDNSADYTITYNNGEAVIRFEEVFLEDQAEYCCKATNQLGVDVCSAKLSVEPLEPTEAPSFITPLSNIMARAGQKIKLECEVTGLPTPELSWNHNGKIVQETHDIRIQYDDKKATLVVNEAFPKDAGVYVVSAKNIAGEATSSCNVTVKGRLPTETSDSELASDMEPVKPAIQLSLKDMSVFEGQRVMLDCIIIGQPEPEVIWYHNDRPVKESTDIKLLFQGDRCSLVIEEAYLEDAGDYKVVAINSGGEASSKCSLSVKSVSETDPAMRGHLAEEVVEPTGVAPKFSKLLTDVLAPEGDKVTFECCVNGEPKPDVKWYLNNEEIHHSDRVQLNHDDEGNVSLTIPEVLPEHRGVYTVKAHNTCGEAKCFASLIVKTISSPEIKHKTAEIQAKPIAPAFQELFADRTVNENDTTKFECVITGKPVPKVEWYFNEAVVSGKNFLVSSSGDRHTLAIFQTSPAHSGSVACVAENEAGKATCVARLSVRTKSPAEQKILPVDSSIISEHQESSSFTMKRSVIVHSSSSHVTSSVSTADSEPNVKVHSYTSQSEERFEQVGDNHPVQVQSQKTEEVLQENRDKPVVHQQTILKVVNGVADHQEAVQATSSTPTYSPKMTRKSTAPRFISPLNGKIVDQGADVILDAVVDGYPHPAVTWHKNGHELSPRDGSVTISQELSRVSLELRNVAVKDAGRYTCKAVNAVGSASSTADVVVKKTIFPPVFGRRLQASVAKAGERVVMNVEVTGTPDPVVTWFKGSQNILGAVPGGPFKTKILGNSYSLIIDKAAPSHSGTYRVKAENAGGEAECIADFIVLETEPQTEPNLQMKTHVIFKDVREETVQQSDHHLETRSSKVTTEPETTKKSTAEVGTSPISLSPHGPSPSIEKPITTESTTVTESIKTEKLFSIKVERTPSPAFQKLAEEARATQEVQIPVKIEQTPKAAPSVSETKEIPLRTEESKSDREDLFEIQDSKITEDQFVEQEIPQQEMEDTGIETGSISKKTALNFFVSKISEKESDAVKDRLKEPEVISLKTSVKDNISQFEERHLKEYDQLYRPKETDTHTTPVTIDKTDDTREITHKPLTPHVGDLSKDLPSLVSKTEKEQLSSEIQSETRTKMPSRDSQIQELPHISQSTKFNTFPLQSPKSHFRTEESRYEKYTTQHYVHHTSSLDEFHLLPEPPPEMGYIPKTEVPAKPHLDMPSRVKKLEESHRVLSPVEIPSGAVRIFPAPVVPETPTAEKFEPQAKPHVEDKLFTETEKIISMSDKEKVIEEVLTKKEIVEQMSVQKKIQLPGAADWTCPHPVSATQPVTERHAAPVKPVSRPQAASVAPAASVVPATAVQPPWRTQTVQTGTQQSSLESLRSASPRPSAEALVMEKLWASSRVPEPEVVSLPVAPLKETQVPKPLVTESTEKYVTSTITKSSVQETEIRRAASPRPSAEGIAMEKLWTPHKPVEPESSVTRPVTTTPPHFEKAMSPKPSMEGLAMDKIWAHKHPDSALKTAWPPVQPVEEKPVIPWTVKGNIEKVWPPPEPVQAVHQQVDTVSQKQVQVQQEETKLVRPSVKEEEMTSSEVKTDHRTLKEETRSSTLHMQTAPAPAPPSSTLHMQTAPAPAPPSIQHYVAEARVVHSSALLQTEVQSTTISTEHLETKSEKTETVTSRSSPPVVEEQMLRPSAAKRLWPPGVKDEYELKSPPILKDVLPRKEILPKPKPVQEVTTETFLEPGPPPEIGFAPAPPVERRQSLVETIEQEIQRDLEKEPTRRLVGAVRTLPSPPVKDKAAPPPLPPKEKSVPPPLPPKEKVPEMKAVPPLKKETKTPVVTKKPFERFPDLEPFPFQPDEPAPKPAKCPPPAKPSKFVKGEFASSDYESDIESVHIASKWRPYESDTEEVLGYRKVAPPTSQQPRRPKSTEPDPLPPSKFDQPPQFAGPPRPAVERVQAGKKDVKEVETEISKVTSKIEMKTEKVKKHHHHHHHASESKRKLSPPALKPGSPPIFVQPAAADSIQDGEAKPTADQKKGEPLASPKPKPDSPKFKTKTTQSEFPESGYMADTDEPRHLRQATHKYSHFKHEESSKMTVEHTTIVTSEVSEQSTQSVQQQQKSEKLLPTKPHPSPKLHHRHSDHKSDKKAVTSSTTGLSKAKKDVPTAPVTDVTHTTHMYREEQISNLEPFPFKAEPTQPAVKRAVGPPPPSPSKFVKGEFRESDYESDYDGRIPAKWRPCDSDADEPSYKPVRPVLTPSGRQSHSQASLEVRTPTPPTEFDNPPQFGSPPRPKFEPIEKPSPPVKSEIRKTGKPQKVLKPTAVIPRPPSPIELIVATPAVKQPDVTLQPGSPPELGYAPAPARRTAPYQNATQMETSKVMKFAEATEHSRRVVSLQQTTRVIKFGDKEQKVQPEPKLEPFPFRPEPETEWPRQKSGPPPTMPKKFVPGEFRESDYESDYEGVRIKPKWAPGDSDTDEPHYRKVRPPPVARSTSVPAKPSDYVPSPMEFDTQPVALPNLVTVEPKTKLVSALDLESERKTLKRVEELRSRFSKDATSSVQQKTPVTAKGLAAVQPSQQALIKPGEPPEYGFVPASASYVASKHMSQMTDTFKSKAQQFMDDIMTDVKCTKENGHVEKQKAPVPSAETDPQAYREESRLSEYGTKHIDPDTGLIYFKYDFGYEFGIILPGEGDKKRKYVHIENKRDDDIVVPVIHETSSSEKKAVGPQPNEDSGKVPQFRPKKFSHYKSVKWEPMSESEMSEAEGDAVQQHKKRHTLPQPQVGSVQKAPHILIPQSCQWDQASSSPVSLSPSLPSLSPHYGSQGPHGTTSGVDSTVSPGGSWQGLSPSRGQRSQGRGSTPTPPSTPSTPGSAHGTVGQLTQPRKPPTFITPLRDIAVVSGQNARFECIVQAEPPPNILWSKNGRIIDNSQNYQIQYRNGVCRLTIPQAFPEDAGSYTCTATNMLGTVGTTGSLQVPGERRSVHM